MLQSILDDIDQKQGQATKPAFSTFVSASAGTGKTKVLVDRFIRLMLETNASPQKILCITYTNTAADEIKHRLITRLSELNAKAASVVIDSGKQVSHNRIRQIYENFLQQ